MKFVETCSQRQNERSCWISHPNKRYQQQCVYGFCGLGFCGLGFCGLGFCGLGFCGLGFCGLGFCGLGFCGLGFCGLGFCGLGFCGLGFCGLGISVVWVSVVWVAVPTNWYGPARRLVVNTIALSQPASIFIHMEGGQFTRSSSAQIIY